MKREELERLARETVLRLMRENGRSMDSETVDAVMALETPIILSALDRVDLEARQEERERAAITAKDVARRWLMPAAAHKLSESLRRAFADEGEGR